MSNYPGQRSAQTPERAALQAFGALGRSARTTGTMSGSVIAWIDGAWHQLGDDDEWEPYEMNEED